MIGAAEVLAMAAAIAAPAPIEVPAIALPLMRRPPINPTPINPTPINLPPIDLPAIHLEVREAGGQVRLIVVGLSASAYGAHYVLEVSGRGPAGTNRTTQSDAAALRPNERRVLLTIALGPGGAGQWLATLIVTPSAGAPYRQELASGGMAG